MLDARDGGEGMGTLVLIRETKIHHLLPGHGPDSRLEASGVCAQEGHFVIVFDNVGQMARVATSLTSIDRNGWVGDQDGTHGYEDITYNRRHQRFYALIEAVPANGESHNAEVVEYDLRFLQQERYPLPFAFDRGNKGFEGLASVQRGEHDFVLALCEGNGCKGGQEGKQKGDGRIQVFQRDAHGWRHISTLKLPRAARFTDYSSLDIRDGHVAVVSQASSQLWCGTLDPAEWAFIDTGRVWHLPRDARGKPDYCHAEGVAWLAPDQIVIVSDRRKKGGPKRCATKDQSLHVFRIPDSPGGRT